MTTNLQTLDIIGAGITGLTTAWLLLRRGVRVRVHEARPEEAGLAATHERDGFLFDYGPHEFCTENPELIALLEDVTGDDLLVVEKRVAQHLGGALRPFPFRPADILQSLPATKAARAIAEVGWRQVASLWRSADDRNFETWTRSRFGDTLWHHYFGPYTEKVWGVPPAELDADVARRRISVDSAAELLWKTLRYRRRHPGTKDGEAAHSAFRPTFRYFRGGAATLARRLRRAVEDLGGEIVFDRRLERLETRDGRVSGLHFADGTRIESVERLISTVPLPVLARLALPSERAESLLRQNPLPFRGMVFAFVRLACPTFLDHHWVYVPDPEIPFQRLTEFAPFGAAMAPAGQTGLALEIASDPGERWWEADDETITEACLAGLRRLGSLEDDEVLGIEVRRVPRVYPLQIRGFAEHTAAVLEALRPLENLTTLGRQGLFRYCNMNECMEMAIDVAPRLASAEGHVAFQQASTWQGVGLEDRATKS